MEYLPNYRNKEYAVDVASICNLKRNAYGKPMLIVFKMVVKYLSERGVKTESIIGFSDSNFKYYVDDKEGYNLYLKHNTIIEMPAAIKADKAIIAYCLKHDNAVFISQDLMREYYVYLPYDKWIVERRICALVIGDEIYLIPMLEKVPEDPAQEPDVAAGERGTLDVLKEIESSNKDSKWDLFTD